MKYEAKTLDDLKRIFRIAKVRLEKKPKQALSINVTNADSARSEAQNALMWSWNTVIGDHIGFSKNYVHGMMKRSYIPPILAVDRPEEYADWMEIEKTHSHNEELINRLAFKLLPSRELGVKRMTEYLNEIDNDNPDMHLPKPEDQYYEAMGYKRK